MLSMRSEVVAFIISNFSRAFILLGSLSKCRNVIIFCIGRISCNAFSTCSENVDFPVDVAKSPVFVKSGSEVLTTLYYIVLMGWSLLPNALRLFNIYCGP